ncbi:hypothetical protein PFISCL1PPCAC_6650, partial [Pristionchus fissidentatus]
EKKKKKKNEEKKMKKKDRKVAEAVDVNDVRRANEAQRTAVAANRQLQKENEDMKGRLKREEKTKEELVRSVKLMDEMKKEMTKLRESLEESKDRQKQAESDAVTHNARCDSLMSEIHEMMIIIGQAETSHTEALASAASTSAELRREKKDTEEEMNRIEMQAAKLVAEYEECVDSLKKENDELRGQLDEMEN